MLLIAKICQSQAAVINAVCNSMLLATEIARYFNILTGRSKIMFRILSEQLFNGTVAMPSTEITMPYFNRLVSECD